MSEILSYGCHNKAWRQHQAEIRAFLKSRAGNAAEADDLLQEVFLKALLQGKAFCSLDNPRAWLFHVARNLLIDRLRLTREQVPLPEDMSAESGHEFEAVDVLSHCLPRVLSELSPEDREVITQCDLHGVTQQAYAEKMGISLAAAKSRVQRARARLQIQLVSACQVRFDKAGKVCCFVARPSLGHSETK